MTRKIRLEWHDITRSMTFNFSEMQKAWYGWYNIKEYGHVVSSKFNE